MKIDIPTSTKHINRREKLTAQKKREFDLSFFDSFTDKKKKVFYREFSTLIKASIDFNKALELLAQQEKSKKLKIIYEDITEKIVKGKTLYEALEGHKDFTKYEIYSIRIGEETRRLPEVLDQLEKYYDRKIKMRRQIISVMTYPTFVLFITFAVLYFMLNYVVPMFSTVFRQFGGELPPMTLFVQKLSEHFNMGVLILTIFTIVLFCLHYYLKDKERYQEIMGKIILKMPVVGKLTRKINTAKFCQSMGLLLAAKTPLLDSLNLSKEMIHFYPLKKVLERTISDVRKGALLSPSLQRKDFFASREITMLSIGEEVNELDQMFHKLAEQLEEDIDHFVKSISSVLEPIMIIVIGVVVGFILIAMYYPMFSLGKVINA